jgi:hypothetical protein
VGIRFASNKRAVAICDVCGFQYKLKELRNLIVKGGIQMLKPVKSVGTQITHSYILVNIQLTTLKLCAILDLTMRNMLRVEHKLSQRFK